MFPSQQDPAILSAEFASGLNFNCVKIAREETETPLMVECLPAVEGSL